MVFMHRIFFLFAMFLLTTLHTRPIPITDGFEKISMSPEVYVCAHFLSDAECDHIIELAKPELQRSTVLNEQKSGSFVDRRRTSLGMFLPQISHDRVISSIHKRIAEITKIPEANGEGMQVLYYGVGAEYQPHFDYFNFHTAGGEVQIKRGGQRVATFIIYLNTPEEGGATIFPLGKFNVAAEKGKAILFYNMNESDLVDPQSFHGGAPVIKGEKWIVTRWLRERAFH